MSGAQGHGWATWVGAGDRGVAVHTHANGIRASEIDGQIAFREAGIAVARWTVPAGEDEAASKHPHVRWGEPRLFIRLLVADRDAASYATGEATFTLLPRLAYACSAIRAALPELSMSIEERVGNQRRHLGFRLTDDSTAIVQSFEGFPRNGLGEAPVWIWSSDKHCWIEIVVTRRRAATPGSPWQITTSERAP